jgi:O-antigen/teichoic acid export membrane protein
VSTDERPGPTATGTNRGVAAGAWAFLARIGGLGAATVSAMLLSRGLTQSEFGRFAVAASVATGGALIAAGGLNRAMLRDIAGGLAQGDKARAHATLRHGLFALACSIPVGCAVAVLATWILVGHDGSTLLLVAALTAMLAAVLVLSDVLRGLGEYRLANLTTGRNGGTLISALFAAAILPAALRPHTLDGALGLYATACALGLGAAAVTTIYWGRRRTSPGELNAPAPAAGLLLLAGLPFAITQLAAFLGSQVDLWIAAGTLSATDTGAYAAAFRVMSIVTIPLNAAQITMAAAIPALFILGEYEKLEFRLRRAATVATVPAVGALVLCIVFAAPLLGLLFGEAYEDGAPILIALALGQIVNVLTGLCGVALSLCRREQLALRVSLAALAASVVADWVAASLWGVTALAIASAITSALSYLALWWLAHRELGMWTHPFFPSRRALRQS